MQLLQATAQWAAASPRLAAAAGGPFAGRRTKLFRKMLPSSTSPPSNGARTCTTPLCSESAARRPPARRPPAARRHSRDQIPHTLVLQL